MAEAPRLLDIWSRPEVVRWLGDDADRPPLITDLDEARERIEGYHRRSAEPPLGIWAVEETATGAVAGTVLLLTLPNAEHGEVEIGWHLHPDSWGRGFATEAAAVVLAHGFGAGLPGIIAVTHPDNYPSQAVCRRLGLTDEGVREQWYPGPSRVFRLTAEEHASAR